MKKEISKANVTAKSARVTHNYCVNWACASAEYAADRARIMDIGFITEAADADYFRVIEFPSSDVYLNRGRYARMVGYVDTLACKLAGKEHK